MTFQDVLLLVAAMTCGAAVRYGSAPERVLSSAFLASLLLEEAFAALVGREFATQYDAIYLALELVLLLVVCAVALRANRVYPLWLGGAQIIAVAAHALPRTLGEGSLLACELIDTGGVAVGLFVLIVGLRCHARRQQRLGRTYPDWTVAAERV
ncbi:hypothetical protein [Novosphingobium sp. 9U]|uniref:hypothetical protein n=1 Tax=Novosphingobium sp. 9U TaxID=2653158 RepID=UPI0012F3CCB4|nr:hypothetical protein [Novosphingobium sp. 9U]VWX52258.1 membrane hypothetical protein [Novosphingobium sp. 9U]